MWRLWSRWSDRSQIAGRPEAARLIHSHFRASRPLVGLVSLLVRRQFSEMLVSYLGVRRGFSPAASSPGIDHRADPLLVFSIEETPPSSLARPASSGRSANNIQMLRTGKIIVDVAAPDERRLKAARLAAVPRGWFRVSAGAGCGTWPHVEVVERVQMTGDAVLSYACGKIPCDPLP